MAAARARRIVIYGPSGSGKSTLGLELGRRLGLPWVELDAIYHSRPAWDDLSTEEFRAAVPRALAEHQDGWVVDGNYAMVQDLILPLADTAIWLRLPWRTVYPRLVRRTLSRSGSSEPLFGGNYETWRQTLFSKDSMLLWGIKAFRPQSRRVEVLMATVPHTAKVYQPRSPKQVAKVLKRLTPEPAERRSGS